MLKCALLLSMCCLGVSTTCGRHACSDGRMCVMQNGTVFCCEENVTETKSCNETACKNYPCGDGECFVLNNTACCCNEKVNETSSDEVVPSFEAVPSAPVFNETFTLSCTVEGKSRQKIRWKITDSSRTSREVTNSSGPPFLVETFVVGKRTESRLMVTSDGFCLSKSEISCWTSNDGLPWKNKHSFSINQEFYVKHDSSYFIFSESNAIADDKNKACAGNGGHLASITNSETQSFLMKIADQRYANSITDKEGTAFIQGALFKNKQKIKNSKFILFLIGLKRDPEGNGIWTNGAHYNFSYWATASEAESSNDIWKCVYLDRKSQWKWKTTRRCDEIKDYLCEVKGSSFPNIINVKSSRCGWKNVTSLTVHWQSLNKSSDVEHKIRVKHLIDNSFEERTVVPSKEMDEKGITKTTFTNLIPRSKYQVQIFPSVHCSEDHISQGAYEVTGYGRLGKVKNTKVLKKSENECVVIWEWRNETYPTVENFRITVSSFSLHGGYDKKEPDELSAFNASASQRSMSFASLPNRRHVVEVAGQNCAGKGQSVTSNEGCVTSAQAPFLPSPSINASKDEVILKLSNIDQRNGTISCFFVIAQLIDTEEAAMNSSEACKSFLDRISNIDAHSIEVRQPYIALAQQSNLFEKDFAFIIGNGMNTTCDVTKLPNTSRFRRDSDGKVYFGKNTPLQRGKFYSFFVISTTPLYNSSIACRASEVSTCMTDKESLKSPNNGLLQPWMIGLIIGSGVLIIVLLIVFFVIKRGKSRKHSSKKPTTIKLQETSHTIENDAISNQVHEVNNEGSRQIQPNKTHGTTFDCTAIPLHEIKNSYIKMMQTKNNLLKSQFSAITEDSVKPSESHIVASLKENQGLNRYSDILPYDETRVIIEDNPTDSNSSNGYINASYIDSYNSPRHFIAAQGPLDTTVEHFWKMIWQNKCEVVVMLTNVIEKEQCKCVKYWPEEGEEMVRGSLQIATREIISYGCYVARHIEVLLQDENEFSMTVTQYHFTEWPDHDVPITTTGLLRLFNAVLQDSTGTSPIVVHCSAGVGRTGTFIAIDYLSREMKVNSSIDVYTTVMNMRKQRCLVVQTLSQYTFIHKVMTELHLFENTDFFADKLTERIEHLESNSYKEFYNLDGVLPIQTSCSRGSKAANKKKNRSRKYIPYDHSIVNLVQESDEEVNPYINASYLERSSSTGVVIAAEGPMKHTVNAFWRSIVDCSVDVIVMLTKVQEGDRELCFCYWPEEVESVKVYGSISVQLKSANEEEKYIVRKFHISRGETTTEVTQFHYQHWEEHGEPPNVNDLVSVINNVASSRYHAVGTCMIVHCSDGLGRTGVFCALMRLIERLNTEQRVDVFRTVKDLRDMRPGMVTTLDFYKLCYSALEQYISSFHQYANFKG